MEARFTLRFPSNLNTAIEQVANERDYEAGAHESVNKSDIVREAVTLYFQELAEDGELPEETRDLLDEDLKANAGGTEGVADA